MFGRSWDADFSAPLQTFESHPSPVRAVAFSPDGKLLASGSADGIIKLWDTGTGAPLQMLTGHSRGLRTVAFSPDSTLLASGSEDKTVRDSLGVPLLVQKNSCYEAA